MLKKAIDNRPSHFRLASGRSIRGFCFFLVMGLVGPTSLAEFLQDSAQAGTVQYSALSTEPAGDPRPPDEIRYESSVGDVLFPHKLHVKMRCTRCHHQIHAAELNTPHEDYLDSSWINCRTCHDGNLVAGTDHYRCSGCHHSEPENIADETLSSKVVVHKSCWKCHKTGTGVKASAGCADCHVREEVQPESSRKATTP